MAYGAGARGETVVYEFFVFEDETLELAFLGGYLVEGFDV